MIIDRKPKDRLEEAIERLAAAYRVNSQRKQLLPQLKDIPVNKDAQDTQPSKYRYPYKDD